MFRVCRKSCCIRSKILNDALCWRYLLRDSFLGYEKGIPLFCIIKSKERKERVCQTTSLLLEGREMEVSIDASNTRITQLSKVSIIPI